MHKELFTLQMPLFPATEAPDNSHVNHEGLVGKINKDAIKWQSK